MEEDVEKKVDGFLDSIFGGSPSALFISNIIIGAIFIFVAWRLLASPTQSNTRVFGWILLVIGGLGMISGVVQYINKL
ncbi:hypothetical protein PaeBR_20885 [Paenibacillus sp. BR2-3]|uniref:hypothetical protein n=1 Tax=Paenibacillus sp. BR2-3 TaxID=3048494 RepID=UPI003977947D